MNKRITRSSIGEGQEVKKFIVVLMIVLASVTTIYFFTRIFVTKDLLNKQQSPAPIPLTINYELTTIGLMKNRPYQEYYVFVYYNQDQINNIKEAITTYIRSEEAKKVYYLDLAETLNQEYYTTEKTNPKASEIDDLKFGAMTLVQIKDKKVINYWETEEAIINQLR